MSYTNFYKCLALIHYFYCIYLILLGVIFCLFHLLLFKEQKAFGLVNKRLCEANVSTTLKMQSNISSLHHSLTISIMNNLAFRDIILVNLIQ